MSAGPDVKTAEDEPTDNQRIKTSLKKYLRYALLTLLWGAVAAYVIYAGTAAGRLRAGKKVGRVEIEVVDSSSMGYLVSGRMVREWIAHSGIKTNGMAVDAVELAAIEALIAKNGFVERVDAYVTYGSVLHIDISQRRPLLRLLTDGVDSYVTPEGYVFAAPRASSLYVDRKSTRLNSSHIPLSRMPSSA